MSILWMLSEYFDYPPNKSLDQRSRRSRRTKLDQFLDSKDDSLPRRQRGRIPSAMYRDGRPQMRNDVKMVINGESNDESKSKWWTLNDESKSLTATSQFHGIPWYLWYKITGQRWSRPRMVFPDQATELSDGHPETQPTSEVISELLRLQQMLLTSWQVEFLARLTSVHSLLPFGPLFALNGLIMICRYWT